MSPAPASSPSASQRGLFVAAIAAATCQIAFGARFAADDFWVTTTAAWIAALFLARERGSATIVSAGAVSRALGAIACVSAVVALAAMPGYRTVDRVLPLVAGAGIALAASGPRGWLRHRSELLLLALPVMNPPPKVLRGLLSPSLQPLTAWCTMWIDRAAGYAMTADGNILRMPNDALNVVSGCSGLYGITRLFVLAALVAALFPTTAWQRVALFASSVLIGFLVNAARIAVLAVAVMRREDTMFEYWHAGLGSTFFTIASTAAACLAWWPMFRRWRSASPDRDPPCLAQ
jgi:cyanoexosortase A